MFQLKTFKWLLAVALPVVIIAPCQHFDTSNQFATSKASPLPWFQTSTAYAEEAPPAVTWKDLLGLNHHTGKANSAISKFDGKTVGIAGFAVPVAGESEDKITEVLLVPEPMMCIHVPPPPPNQLVHVRLKTPGLVESFVPLIFIGQLKIVKTKSEYGSAGYEMEATRFAPYEW